MAQGPDDERSKKRKSSKQELASTFDSYTVPHDDSLLQPEEFFKGNLKLVQITTLLQSIMLGRMSGRLRVQRTTVWTDVFFDKGNPVHAEGTRGTGEDCLLQTICWKEGDFNFEPKLKTDEKTIFRALEPILLEGALLFDHTEYLKEANVKMATVLYRSNPNLSESEFEAVMAKGDALDIGQLKRVYLAVDGRKNLETIVADHELLRSQWVPLFASLIRLNVLGILNEPQALDSFPTHGKKLDMEMAESARQALLDRETGIFSFGALLFLLGELLRFAGEAPLSVLVVEVQPARATLSVNKSNLPPELIRDVATLIQEVPGINAIVTRFDQNDIAVVLPGLRSDGAVKWAEKIRHAISTTGAVSLPDSSNLFCSIGVACLPDDAKHMSTLLGEAEKAKDRARNAGSGVALSQSPTLS